MCWYSAVALALADTPQANARFDTKTGEVVESDTVDVCVAVATPTGLITPKVTNANFLTLPQIDAKVREAAHVWHRSDAWLLCGQYKHANVCVASCLLLSFVLSPVLSPSQVGDLARRARAGRLAPDEFQVWQLEVV